MNAVMDEESHSPPRFSVSLVPSHRYPFFSYKNKVGLSPTAEIVVWAQIIEMSIGAFERTSQELLEAQISYTIRGSRRGIPEVRRTSKSKRFKLSLAPADLRVGVYDKRRFPECEVPEELL